MGLLLDSVDVSFTRTLRLIHLIPIWKLRNHMRMTNTETTRVKSYFAIMITKMICWSSISVEMVISRQLLGLIERTGPINLQVGLSGNKEFRVSNGSFLFFYFSPAINTFPYMKEYIRRYI